MSEVANPAFVFNDTLNSVGSETYPGFRGVLENTSGEVTEFDVDQPRSYGHTNSGSNSGLANPVGPEGTGEESFAGSRFLSLDGI